MKILSAVMGMVAFMFLAMTVPDYFPYMTLLLWMMAAIFPLVVMAATD